MGSALDRLAQKYKITEEPDAPESPTSALDALAAKYGAIPEEPEPAPDFSDTSSGESTLTPDEGFLKRSWRRMNTVDPTNETQFGKGFRSATARGGMGGLGETLEAFGAERIGGAMREAGERGAVGTDPRVPKFEKAEDWGERGDWIAWNAGQVLGSMAPMFAGGLLAGGGKLAAYAGGAIPSYTQNLGELRSQLREAGVDPDTMDRWAKLGAIPIAALDVIVPGDAATRLLARNIAKRLTMKEMAKETAKRGAVAGIRGGAKESLTEMGQTGMGDVFTDMAAQRPIDVDPSDLFNSGLAGWLGGGMSLGSSVAADVRDAVDSRKIELGPNPVDPNWVPNDQPKPPPPPPVAPTEPPESVAGVSSSDGTFEHKGKTYRRNADGQLEQVLFGGGNSSALDDLAEKHGVSTEPPAPPTNNVIDLPEALAQAQADQAAESGRGLEIDPESPYAVEGADADDLYESARTMVDTYATLIEDAKAALADPAYTDPKKRQQTEQTIQQAQQMLEGVFAEVESAFGPDVAAELGAEFGLLEEGRREDLAAAEKEMITVREKLKTATGDEKVKLERRYKELDAKIVGQTEAIEEEKEKVRPRSKPTVEDEDIVDQYDPSKPATDPGNWGELSERWARHEAEEAPEGSGGEGQGRVRDKIQSDLKGIPDDAFEHYGKIGESDNSGMTGLHHQAYKLEAQRRQMEKQRIGPKGRTETLSVGRNPKTKKWTVYHRGSGLTMKEFASREAAELGLANIKDMPGWDRTATDLQNDRPFLTAVLKGLEAAMEGREFTPDEVTVADEPEEAATPAEKTEAPAESGKPGWKAPEGEHIVGHNADGDVIWEDARGVRSIYNKDKVKLTEPVMMIPTKEGGVDIGVDRTAKNARYLTEEERKPELNDKKQTPEPQLNDKKETPEPEAPKEEVKPFDTRDPFKVLGVERNATDEEIKQAYRRLAAANHPDRHKGDAVYEERFKQIAEAFQTLTNPALRRRFEQSGQTSTASPSQARYTWTNATRGMSEAELEELIREVQRQAKQHQQDYDRRRREEAERPVTQEEYDRAMKEATRQGSEMGKAERQAVADRDDKRDTSISEESDNGSRGTAGRPERDREDVRRDTPEEQPGDVEPPRAKRPASGAPRGQGRGDQERIDGAAGTAEEGSPPASGRTGPSEGGAELESPRPGEGDDRGPVSSEGRGDRESDDGGVQGQPDPVATHNYVITPDDKIGEGSDKQKVVANIEAIRLLKRIMAENRGATPEEQAILVKYTGWGAFTEKMWRDEKNGGPDWPELTAELESLVTEKELSAMKDSGLNAHYTSFEVIAAMYKLLDRLGVPAGARVLEPSAGIGHFLGMAPPDKRLRFSAVELDTITGNMMRLLYPKADIKVAGFETVKNRENAYDVTTGNVPFGSYGVHDPKYNKHNLLIHDYFIVKALDDTHPGGIVALITSHGTLDKATQKARQMMAERGELLGAIRLPTGAFRKNAGTDVVTDILVFRKRAEGETVTPESRAWVTTTTVTLDSGEKAVVSNYFAEHPDMVLGQPYMGTGKNGMPELKVKAPVNLAARLDEAIQKLPEKVYAAPEREGNVSIQDDEKLVEGSFVIKDGKLLQAIDGKLTDATIPQSMKTRRRLTALVKLKELYRRQLNLETADAPVAEIEKSRAELNKAYDAFRKEYGPLSKVVTTHGVNKNGVEWERVKYPAVAGFMDDPDWNLVFNLDVFDEETGITDKAKILTERQLMGTHIAETADSPDMALVAVLAESGSIDFEKIAKMVGQSEDEVKEALMGRLVFKNPVTGALETDDVYLSGNTRQKLKEARKAAKKDKSFEANVRALEGRQPNDVPPSEVAEAANIGASWIPTTMIERFADYIFGATGTRVRYSPMSSRWKAESDYRVTRTAAYTNTYSVQGKPGQHLGRSALVAGAADNLLTATLNGVWVEITVPNDIPGEKPVVHPELTQEARDKQKAIIDAFDQWTKTPAVASELAKLFNEKVNVNVMPRVDGSGLVLHGVAANVNGRPFSLMRHQMNAIWRAIRWGNTLLAHPVGAGKTFEMVGIIMEHKRLGLAQKPLLTVPNHMLAQAAREFRQMYPNARLLVATEDDFEAPKRKAFIAKAAAHDWDAIIMTHSSFKLVPVGKEIQQEYIAQEMAILEQAYKDAEREDGARAPSTKDIRNAMRRLQKKLDALLAQHKDDFVTFEDMRVDMIVADEFHMFKNLDFPTRMRSMQKKGSGAATDLYMKSMYTNKVNPGRGLFGATGTPLTNSVAEQYVLMRYFQPDVLKELGMESFDAWAASFGRSTAEIEVTVTGAFKLKERFREFRNVYELMAAGRQFMDVVKQATPGEEIKPNEIVLPKPALKGGKPEVVVSPVNEHFRRYKKYLGWRAKNLPRGRPQKGDDIILNISTDARHAAIDMRLVSRRVGDLPNSKANQAVRRLFDIYKRTNAIKGVQAVFLDFGVPGSDSSSRGGVPGFNVYDDIRDKLVALGIPREEIVFIQEAKNKKHKAQILEAVNRGKIRIIIGSSEGMGAGTNMQQRLVALHRLDSVWRPDWVEQTEGRILRMGNMLYDSGKIPYVEIFRYVQEGSFDTFMWQKVETKQGFIEQALQADPEVRRLDELGEERLTPEQVKALSSDDPRHMQKAGLSALVTDLKRRKTAFFNAQASAVGELDKLPGMIEDAKKKHQNTLADIEKREDTSGDKFTAVITGETITKRPEAGKAIQMEAARLMMHYYGDDRTKREKSKERQKIGTFAGFDLFMELLEPDRAGKRATVHLLVKGNRTYKSSEIHETDTAAGAVATLEAVPRALERHAESAKMELDVLESRLRGFEGMGADAGWPLEGELEAKEKELEELELELAQSGADLDAGLDGSINQKNWDILPDEVLDEDDAAESGNDDGPLGEFLKDEEGSLNLSAVWASITGKNRPTSAIESEFPEVEKRLLESEGGPKPKRLERALETLRRSMRHYENIDESASPMWAEIQNILLRVEHAKEWATAWAQDAIDHAIRGLDKGELRNFTRLIILPDILKDIEAGLYDEKPLPFDYTLVANAAGITPQEAVERDLAKLEAGASQKVKDAVAKREQFQQALTQELVAHGLLPESVLEDDRYYHRQVLEYMEGMEEGSRPREVRNKVRGFQRGRTGGGDFNTRYDEAESEWVIQALREIQMAKMLKRIQKLSDITKELKAEAKEMNRQLVKTKTGKLPPATVSARALRQELGDKLYVEWKTLIPADYTIWSPAKGHFFFRGMGIAAQEFSDLIAAGAGPAEVAAALRSQLMVGSKPEWVVPKNLAAQLDWFNERPDPAPLKGYTKLQGMWRMYILLNPVRWLKYNINNMAGDLDASILYPKIHAHTGQATKDVIAFYLRKTASPALRKEMLELTELRVLNNTLTVADIPDLADLPAIERMLTAGPLQFMKYIAQYWHYARLLTTARENVLRLAAYRYFQAEIAAGRNPGAVVSNRQTAKALKGDELAAQLSNDLIGDYGAVSQNTQVARKYFMAFPSWLEINAKRYIRLYVNAMRDEGPGVARVAAAAGTHMAVKGTVKVAAATLMANIFFLFATAWNHLLWPEEEEELRKEGRTLHLIFGRYSDGSVRAMRLEGAFADFLEWLRFEDYPADIRDVVTGKATIGEKVKDAVSGPVDKLIGGMTPLLKLPLELATGWSLYPTFRRPRQIRDRADYAFSAVSLAFVYRKATDKPIRGSREAAGAPERTLNALQSMLFYRIDPGEAAYFHVRELASKFLASKRGDPGAIRASDRSNALYYFKLAARNDQPERASRWLQKYYDMGGTKKGAQLSIGTGDPLQFLPKKYRAEFKKSLDSDELRALEIAERYSKSIGREKALDRWRKTPYAKHRSATTP